MIKNFLCCFSTAPFGFFYMSWMDERKKEGLDNIANLFVKTLLLH
jgi:hypothetical protein